MKLRTLPQTGGERGLRSAVMVHPFGLEATSRGSPGRCQPRAYLSQFSGDFGAFQPSGSSATLFQGPGYCSTVIKCPAPSSGFCHWPLGRVSSPLPVEIHHQCSSPRRPPDAGPRGATGLFVALINPYVSGFGPPLVGGGVFWRRRTWSAVEARITRRTEAATYPCPTSRRSSSQGSNKTLAARCRTLVRLQSTRHTMSSRLCYRRCCTSGRCRCAPA